MNDAIYILIIVEPKILNFELFAVSKYISLIGSILSNTMFFFSITVTQAHVGI